MLSYRIFQMAIQVFLLWSIQYMFSKENNCDKGSRDLTENFE